MANTNFSEKVIANAIRTYEGKCFDRDHEGCVVTHYITAQVMTHGSDKAHKMDWSMHSADGKLFGGSSPACGSKQHGYNWSSSTAFRPEVTCGRCK